MYDPWSPSPWRVAQEFLTASATVETSPGSEEPNVGVEGEDVECPAPFMFPELPLRSKYSAHGSDIRS